MTASCVRSSDSGVQAHAERLLALAEAAIDHGLAEGRPPAVDPARYPPPLRAQRAAFVTLLDGDERLRGCIGSIEARRTLVEDVNANAFAAAFEDPRFAPLTPAERGGLQCKLSILTRPEPIHFEDEADLVGQLEPGTDGVLLVAGEQRGTLLPAVWEQIPEPLEFWRMVKRKAGLDPASFPLDLDVYRYRAETLG